MAVGKSEIQNLKSKIQNLAAYALLCGLSALFALPFLWMVSSGFKDLETIFEYPPTLLPMETSTTIAQGRTVPVGIYNVPPFAAATRPFSHGPGRVVAQGTDGTA